MSTIDATATSAAELVQEFLQRESAELTRRGQVILRRATAELPDDARKDLEASSDLTTDLDTIRRTVLKRLVAERLSNDRRRSVELIGLEDVAGVTQRIMASLPDRRGASSKDIELATTVLVQPGVRESIKGLVRFLEFVDADYYRAMWRIHSAVLEASLEVNRTPMAALEDSNVRAAVIRSIMERDAWDEYVAGALRLLKRLTGVERIELAMEAQGQPVDSETLAKQKEEARPLMAELVAASAAYYEERTAEIWPSA